MYPTTRVLQGVVKDTCCLKVEFIYCGGNETFRPVNMLNNNFKIQYST